MMAIISLYDFLADLLHVNPDDATVFGLKDGDNARVVSKYGETILPVCTDSAIRKGEAFSPFYGIGEACPGLPSQNKRVNF